MNKIQLLIWGILSFSTISYSATHHSIYKTGFGIQENTTSLSCSPEILEAPIDRMFRQIKVIIDKHSIEVVWLDQALRRWKRDQRNLSIQLLLRIAILFNVNPSVLLSSETLESQVQIYNFKAYLASSEDVRELLLSVNQHLQNVIHSSGLTLSQFAIKSKLSLQLLAQISTGHVPNLFKLSQILEPSDIDIVDFFRNVESSSNFSIQDFRSHFVYHWKVSTWENQQLQWIRQRVKHVTDLAKITPTVREMIGIDMLLLHQHSLLFSSLFKLSDLVHIKMNIFLNPEITLNSKHIKPENVKKQSLLKEDIQKAYKVLIYLIKLKMVELELSIQELAIRSGINFQTLRSILSKYTKEDLNYLNLLKIVVRGLDIKLADFLVDLEKYVEQFDHIDFDISLPQAFSHKSQKVQDILKHLESRATELINLTGLSVWRIKDLTGTRSINSQIDRVTIAASLRFVHIFGITFSQFSSNDDLKYLINPERLNLERLPDPVITNALITLSDNIQSALTNASMSLSDLQIRTGVSKLIELNSILNGRKSATIRKASEVAEGLDKSLPEIFKGVSTF